MPSTSKNNSKEPLIRIYSTPKLKKRMKPRRLTMPANLRNPQKNVDEIVKRYSMQLEAKEADEKLSEECLAEINTLEKSFQELDSFELQVEPVKSPPNEDVEMKGGNNEDDKKDKEKSKNSGNKKGKKAKFTKKNTKLQVQEEDKPTHRRSIRHLSS
uniref:Candidate secreted effector n=1 Tax=Meloidogyne incognita TaxID=6306 RepID=A0A914NJD5_MELIC